MNMVTPSLEKILWKKNYCFTFKLFSETKYYAKNKINIYAQILCVNY